jgi:hypothetical protein
MGVTEMVQGGVKLVAQAVKVEVGAVAQGTCRETSSNRDEDRVMRDV